jgi:hypothetical protein
VVTNLNVDVLGTYVITYQTKDASGNKSPMLTRVIVVRDTEKPVITLKGLPKVTLEVFNTYDDKGITVNDNYYTINTWATTGTFFKAFPDGKATILGTYTIIYTVTDGSGNTATATRTIEVVDTKPPVITLKGDPSVTICRWAIYTDAGYDIKDNYWPLIDLVITREGSFASFSTSLSGLYSFRYKGVDKSANIGYSDYRFVLVSPAEDVNCVSSVKDIKALANQINVFPNPSNGQFTIKADFATTEKVKIAISNIYGQEVAVINNGVLSNNSFQVDLSNQAAGMYTISFIMSNNIVTKQVVITK